MTFRLLAIEIYKCFKKFDHEYLNDISIIKESPYGCRNDFILDSARKFGIYYTFCIEVT